MRCEVGLDGAAEVHINFGQHPYKYTATPYKKLAEKEKIPFPRFLTHLTTDKVLNSILFQNSILYDVLQPIYRPGDTLYFRGWVLNAHDNSPIIANNLFTAPQLKIISPSDAEVLLNLN